MEEKLVPYAGVYKTKAALVEQYLPVRLWMHHNKELHVTGAPEDVSTGLQLQILKCM